MRRARFRPSRIACRSEWKRASRTMATTDAVEASSSGQVGYSEFILMKKESFDPGLTTQFSGVLRRVINPDGTFNVHRKGTRLRDVNLYLKMIDTTWPRFFLMVTLVFLAVNVAFAWLYLAIGVDRLQGTES